VLLLYIVLVFIIVPLQPLWLHFT